MLDTTPTSHQAPLEHSQTRYIRGWLGLSDRSAVVALIVCVLAITALPYLYAYSSSPPNRHFVGVLLNVPDSMQYLSWMRDHRTAWLVSDRMTPEPNEPALFNLLWLIMGRLGVATGWSIPVLFQGLRLFAGTILLLVLYGVCNLFTRSRAERWTAYLVSVAGAGLGWIWVIEKYARGLTDLRYPLDVYVAEPNTLLTIMAFPHFAVASALIMAIFVCCILALGDNTLRYASIAAALGLVLTLQHAYDLVIISFVPAGALGLMLLRDRRIPWRGVATLLLIICLAAPPAIYFTVLTTQSALWRKVLAQFANAGVFTPSPPRLLIVMGVPLILVTMAIIWDLTRLSKRARNRDQVPARPAAYLALTNSDLFLWSWFGIGLLLLYIPTDFQIHMFNSWQVPVALLAARFLHRRIIPVLAAQRSRLARLAPILLILAVLPTSGYLLAWRFIDLGRHRAPYYISQGEDAALTWLDQHTGKDAVVLSGLNLGQKVPARSDARAFVSHWAQTVDYFGKQEQVRMFFTSTTSDQARMALLQQFKVTYILYGEEEQSLGSFDISHSTLLEPVFSSAEVTVYRVR